MIDITQLEEKIVSVFLDQTGLHFSKNYTEFKDSQGKLVADHINFLIVEERDGDAPLIFSIVTPFDEVTKKAPQQAVIFHKGVAQASIDYTNYADMRTGIMDTIVLKRIFDDLSGKNILVVGSGKTAKWSLQCLGALVPGIDTVSYANTSGQKSKFEAELAGKMKLVYKENPEPSDFDIVICHTSSKESVFSTEQLKKMKPGSFVSFFNKTEIPEEFLAEATQVIYDWEGNVDDGSDKYFLKDLLGGKELDVSGVTVFKSSGTPLQNFAVLKMIYDEKDQ